VAPQNGRPKPVTDLGNRPWCWPSEWAVLCPPWSTVQHLGERTSLWDHWLVANMNAPLAQRLSSRLSSCHPSHYLCIHTSSKKDDQWFNMCNKCQLTLNPAQSTVMTQIMRLLWSRPAAWNLLPRADCSRLRLRSHKHECESSSVVVLVYKFRKRKFACICMVAVHIHTRTSYLQISLVRVISVQDMFLSNSQKVNYS